MRNKKFFALTAACMLSTTLLFTGCSNNNASDSNNDATASGVVDGTYEASAAGIESDVKVTITVADGKITDCTIDASGETEGLGTVVPDTLNSEIVEKQGVDVEAVSGATITSNAALTALADCMEQAGLTK